MKKQKIIILTVLLFSFQITFCQNKFEKLPEQKTDKGKIEFASKIACSYFETLKTGNHYDFKDEATIQFKKSMTPELQMQSYLQIKQAVGNFKSIYYSETWIENEKRGIEIIRFKGKFERSIVPLEIRVVINSSNKIAGFWIKPWKDNLNES
ncbi:hypothetical protein [Labilibaculum filiforme]|nr:hypothetical protein [Labilibaculum filiforme]